MSASAALRRGLLSDESIRGLRQSYVESGPYKHVVIQDVFDTELLRRVRLECLSALHATYKETDIYSVFQTGDLANLDGLPEDELRQVSALKTLRDTLYSDAFRAFIENVAGVGRLSPSKKDLSCNIYKPGCHLLCHDDVIGSRSVSYILYLTDPDEPWREDEGGALELYPVIAKGTPATNPSVTIPVKWNQLAMFAVQPGLSFHSVAEVRRSLVTVARSVVSHRSAVQVVADEGRDRLSISGWFHVLQDDDLTDEERASRQERSNAGDAAPASLEQIVSSTGGKPFAPTLPAGDDSAWVDDNGDVVFLSADEVDELRRFVNPLYLKPSVIMQANETFASQASIQLTSFLRDDVADQVRDAIEKDDERCGFFDERLSPAVYDSGVVDGVWTPTGPPHIRRYVELAEQNARDDNESGRVLQALRDDLFKSSHAFRHLLYLITSFRPVVERGAVRRFRPGLDYTLATSTPAPDPTTGDVFDGVLDATLCFVANGDDVWASDEVGGFECYMVPDDDNEDPAQYRAAADVADGTLSVSAGCNVLNLVLRPTGVMKFVKYVSASAPGSRWDVAWEYRVVQDIADDVAEA